MSNAWRGILRAVPILLKGIKKYVRNGRRTSFWLDSWCDVTSFRELAICDIPSSEIEKTVASYWVPQIGWDWDQLTNLLSEQQLDNLAVNFLIEDSELEDSILWSKEPNGYFSTSSAYDLAMGTTETIDAAKWNSVWKLKVPNRIRTFLWLVCHDKLMTNHNSVKRGIASCDYCGICSGAVEDIEHVLCGCPEASSLWNAVLPPFDERFRSSPFSLWLEKGLAKSREDRTPSNDNTLFAITSWWIWRWRNEAIFSNSTKPLEFKIAWVNSQANETIKAFATDRGKLHPTSSSRWEGLSWKRPQEGFVKINIDGSVEPNTSKAGYGGVICDHSGSWKHGFMHNLGCCSPQVAEAWALLKGIQFAAHWGWRKRILTKSQGL